MPGPDATQRLAAILAADAAGYTRLMHDDESATMATLDEYRGIFRQHIEANRGRLVDTAGDSVLAVFEIASGAVGAAQRGDARGPPHAFPHRHSPRRCHGKDRRQRFRRRSQCRGTARGHRRAGHHRSFGNRAGGGRGPPRRGLRLARRARGQEYRETGERLSSRHGRRHRNSQAEEAWCTQDWCGRGGCRSDRAWRTGGLALLRRRAGRDTGGAGAAGQAFHRGAALQQSVR